MTNKAHQNSVKLFRFALLSTALALFSSSSVYALNAGTPCGVVGTVTSCACNAADTTPRTCTCTQTSSGAFYFATPPCS